eukprot:jgi/Tetstr1/457496/TSEL_044078.t1
MFMCSQPSTINDSATTLASRAVINDAFAITDTCADCPTHHTQPSLNASNNPHPNKFSSPRATIPAAPLPATISTTRAPSPSPMPSSPTPLPSTPAPTPPLPPFDQPAEAHLVLPIHSMVYAGPSRRHRRRMMLSFGLSLEEWQALPASQQQAAALYAEDIAAGAGLPETAVELLSVTSQPGAIAAVSVQLHWPHADESLVEVYASWLPAGSSAERFPRLAAVNMYVDITFGSPFHQPDATPSPDLPTEPGEYMPSLHLALGEDGQALNDDVVVHRVTLPVSADGWADPGASAWDAQDGDLSDAITVQISSSDLSRPTLDSEPVVFAYSVADADGNVVLARRLLHLLCAPGERLCESEDRSRRPLCSSEGVCLGAQFDAGFDDTLSAPAGPREPPSIELLGPAVLHLPRYSNYDICSPDTPWGRVCERGATAHDPLQGDLTADVVACPSGAPAGLVLPFAQYGLSTCGLDTSVPGKYVLEFSVLNDEGLGARISREVWVDDICPGGERLCGNSRCSVETVCVDSLLQALVSDDPFMESQFAELLGGTAGGSSGSKGPRAELRLKGPRYATVRLHVPWRRCPAPTAGEPCDEGAAVLVGGEAAPAHLHGLQVLACPPPACVQGLERCLEHRFDIKGVDGCLPPLESRQIGETYTVPFVLVSSGAAAFEAQTQERFVTVTSSCAAGMFFCGDALCSPVPCGILSLIAGESAPAPPPLLPAGTTIQLHGPQALRINFGVSLPANASLLPCSASSDADVGSGGSYCGATALAADGPGEPEAEDVSHLLQVAVTRASNGVDGSSCSPCDAVLLAAGLCPPGRYTVRYSLVEQRRSGGGVAEEVPAETREVVVYEDGTLTVRMTYSLATGTVSFMGVPRQDLPQALTTVSGASNEVLRRAVVNVLRGTATQPELPARFSGSLSSVGMEDVSIVAATESQGKIVMDVDVRLAWAGAEDSCTAVVPAPGEPSPVETLLQLSNDALRASMQSGGFSAELATIAQSSGLQAEGFELLMVEDRSAGLSIHLEAMAAILTLHMEELHDMLGAALTATQALGRDLQPSQDEAAMQQAEFSFDVRALVVDALSAALDHTGRAYDASRLNPFFTLEQIEGLGAALQTLKTFVAEDLVPRYPELAPFLREGKRIASGLYNSLDVFEFSADHAASESSQDSAGPLQSEGRRRLLAAGGGSGGGSGGGGRSSRGRAGGVDRAYDASQWDGVEILQEDALAGVSVWREEVPRFVGRRNRLLTGVLLHQQRTAPRVLPDMCTSERERFHAVTTICNDIDFLAKTVRLVTTANSSLLAGVSDPLAPYGTDPVFQSTDKLYNPAAQQSDYYNTTAGSAEINAQGAAHWFFPRPVAGLSDGFPLLLEARMSRRRASEAWHGLDESAYVDVKTETVSARMATYNPQEGSLCVGKLSFVQTRSGLLDFAPQLQALSTVSATSGAPFALYIAEMALGAALCCYLLSRIRRDRAAAPFHLALLCCVIALQVVHALNIARASALAIKPSYDIYDASHSSLARWWMPFKGDDSSTRDTGVVSPRGGAGRWQLPDDNSGLGAFVGMLQDIDAVLRLRTLSQLLQAATVCMMLFHWVSFASCNPSIERIRNTLASSAPDLGHFFVLLGILLVLAAGMCHVALGDQLRSMSTMSGSIESMFMLMVASYLGGINDLAKSRAVELSSAELALTHLLLFLLPIFMIFFMLNFLLAILGRHWGAQQVIRVEKEKLQQYQSQYGYPLVDVLLVGAADAGVYAHNAIAGLTATAQTGSVKVQSGSRKLKKHLSSLVSRYPPLPLSASLVRLRSAPLSDGTSVGTSKFAPSLSEVGKSSGKHGVRFRDPEDPEDPWEEGASLGARGGQRHMTQFKLQAIRDEHRYNRRQATATLLRTIKYIVEQGEPHKARLRRSPPVPRIGLRKLLTGRRPISPGGSGVQGDGAAMDPGGAGTGRPGSPDSMYAELQEALAVLSMSRLLAKNGTSSGFIHMHPIDDTRAVSIPIPSAPRNHFRHVGVGGRVSGRAAGKSRQRPRGSSGSGGHLMTLQRIRQVRQAVERMTRQLLDLQQAQLAASEELARMVELAGWRGPASSTARPPRRTLTHLDVRTIVDDVDEGTAEEQPTAASRPGKEGLEAEPAVLRQQQLLQHQVVLAALVVVVDARAPSEVLRDHVWTRPTPSTVERRTMRLPAGLSFRCDSRCKPAVAQHSRACMSRSLSHPQGAGGSHTQLIRYGHRRACVAAGGRRTRDEGVIWKGDPGDFYMKVIAKKFRGVWHYGVITGVVTEWVLEDYGGATQWRAVFEDGDIVDLLRSEVVEAMAAAQEHPTVDADGEARLVTVHQGDDLSRSGKVTVQSGWVMEDCLHHMETFSILNAGPLLEEARVKAIMTEKELRVPRRWTRSLGRGGLDTPRGAKARRPGQRGAKARRPGQRGAKARRPGQRGAKARRPGQRGAKARRPGQRGAKARRPGQRGAKARRPGERGAKARRPGERGAKARRPGQRGAKARRPGQRGAKARRPGQRGAKTAAAGAARRQDSGGRGSAAPRQRRPGQRGAKTAAAGAARRQDSGGRGSAAPRQRRPGQRGAKARRPGQRGAKARRPGQRGAKARRPGQRGAKARRPGQRGAKARRPGQRGAKTAAAGAARRQDSGGRGSAAPRQRRPGQRGAKTAAAGAARRQDSGGRGSAAPRQRRPGQRGAKTAAAGAARRQDSAYSGIGGKGCITSCGRQPLKTMRSCRNNPSTGFWIPLIWLTAAGCGMQGRMTEVAVLVSPQSLHAAEAAQPHRH